MTGDADRDDTLFGARLLLVSPGAPENHVIAANVERRLERLRPHDQGVAVPMVKGIDARGSPFLIRIGDEYEAVLGGKIVTELDQGPELPGRFDVEQWERRF
jgi:hypothetical protein